MLLVRVATQRLWEGATKRTQGEINMLTRIELPSTKMTIVNLRVLASALYGPDATVETHYVLGKPNYYSVNGGPRGTAGDTAEALRFVIECENPGVEFFSEYNGHKV